MRNAFSALAFSLVAALGSMIGADPIITLISVVAAVVRCAWAFDASQRTATVARPVYRGVRPYRLLILR